MHKIENNTQTPVKKKKKKKKWKDSASILLTHLLNGN